MFLPVFSITPTILTNVEQMGRIVGFLQAVRLPSRYEGLLIRQGEKRAAIYHITDMGCALLEQR